MPREDADVLPLRGEVHLLEEGVEAGIGAEGVEREPAVEKRHEAVPLIRRLTRPFNSLIVVAHPKTDVCQRGLYSNH